MESVLLVLFKNFYCNWYKMFYKKEKRIESSSSWWWCLLLSPLLNEFWKWNRAEENWSSRGRMPTSEHREKMPSAEHKGRMPSAGHRGRMLTLEHKGSMPTAEHRGWGQTSFQIPVSHLSIKFTIWPSHFSGILLTFLSHRTRKKSQGRKKKKQKKKKESQLSVFCSYKITSGRMGDPKFGKDLTGVLID